MIDLVCESSTMLISYQHWHSSNMQHRLRICTLLKIVLKWKVFNYYHGQRKRTTYCLRYNQGQYLADCQPSRNCLVYSYSIYINNTLILY